jgi:predicted ATP-grasp superfamily ATP-dependent carboligase
VLRPEDLYEVVAEPATPADGTTGPVLLHALDGFVDAGSSASLAVGHLLGARPSREVAVFDTDLLVDYRSRRPRMTFRQDRFTEVDMPRLAVREVTDEAGNAFLVLSGPEPDVLWERFAEAVVQLARRFGVRLVVGLHGIPWPAPHTRPVGLTPHATDRALIAGRPRWVGDVDVPGHASALLELRVGAAGIPAVGFTAHVPHYLAATPFPPAAAALVEAVAEVAGLKVSAAALKEAGADVLAQVDAQVAQDDETSQAVAGLERQYDAVASGRVLQGPGLLSPSLPEEEMPDGDALAADLERFLREVDGGRDAG